MRTFGSVFFFFQAEDGIRDTSVTGVQTCALPISLPPIDAFQPLAGDDELIDQLPLAPRQPRACERHANDLELLQALIDVGSDRSERGCHVDFRRSEERRVGKECRSRWSSYLGGEK